MNIGIFGGAFNPVHNGHMALAEHYVDFLNLDRLIFVPTALPPHKANNDLIDGKYRIDMLNIAIDANKIYSVDDCEFHRNGKSYTVDTMKYFKDKFPDDKFYLIVGEDQYLHFDKWYKFDEILGYATVVTAARHRDKFDELCSFKQSNAFMKNSIVSDFDVTEVSSSEIRDKIKNGVDVSHIVPEKVNEYIKEHNLYV